MSAFVSDKYNTYFKKFARSVEYNGENKIEYFFDEEKRTVVAVMKNCEGDVYNILESLGIDDIMEYRTRNVNLLLKSVYRGKAKCSPEDVWNKEEGMRIARNRLLEKYYRDYSSNLNKAFEIFKKISRKFERHLDCSNYRFVKACSGKL